MIISLAETFDLSLRFSPSEVKSTNSPLLVLIIIIFNYVFPLVFEQDILEYKKKQRPQKIKMLDGAVKTIMVDDSKTVGELLVTICSRIGTS